MGKKDCSDNRKLSMVIEENNKQAHAARSAREGTPSQNPDEIETLDAANVSIQSTIIDLTKKQAEHQQGCPECQKGD
jgi:hypothetical protein